MAKKVTKQASRRMFATRNDIPLKSREKIVALLNAQLADLFDLYSHTKQAHWNVKGPEFFQLHKLYDELAEELLEHVDVVAERATSLGGIALGTARMAAAATRLPEYTTDIVDGTASLKALALRFAELAESTRAAMETTEQEKDLDTTDLFTDLSRDLDKSLWFLEAHLQSR